MNDHRDIRCDDSTLPPAPDQISARSPLDRIRRALASRRQRAAWASLASRTRLRWWLIYGPVRSGTSLMTSILASRSRLFLSDWGLGPMLRLTHDLPYVRFDRERALRDISRNLLENAYQGQGQALELLCKEATLEGWQYEALTKMWGDPERRIFCFREPASYMVRRCGSFPTRR